LKAANIVKRVDEEFDKGIFVNRTLKPYEWSRDEFGEWKKGPPTSVNYKVYTLPPNLSQKRKNKFSIEGGAAQGEDGETQSAKMPVDGHPTSWYKRKGKWLQMKVDELGFIDPNSMYGKMIDRDSINSHQEESEELALTN
jgi:hypothetical protein